jgi:hypothetical protein
MDTTGVGQGYHEKNGITREEIHAGWGKAYLESHKAIFPGVHTRVFPEETGT